MDDEDTTQSGHADGAEAGSALRVDRKLRG